MSDKIKKMLCMCIHCCAETPSDIETGPLCHPKHQGKCDKCGGESYPIDRRYPVPLKMLFRGIFDELINTRRQMERQQSECSAMMAEMQERIDRIDKK